MKQNPESSIEGHYPQVVQALTASANSSDMFAVVFVLSTQQNYASFCDSSKKFDRLQ